MKYVLLVGVSTYVLAAFMGKRKPKETSVAAIVLILFSSTNK